jgi:glucose/arabinose dehydrogenase
MNRLSRTLVPTSLLLLGLASPLRADDADHGKVLFQQSCALCHAVGLGGPATAGQGPLLAGVVGRKAGSLPNFGYTKALQASGITWDAATLATFLQAPAALVPGTAMVVAVASPTDRADLVAYLATLPAVDVPAGPVQTAHPRTAGDWQNDAPGVHHEVDLAALPAPYATASAGNAPKVLDRPVGATPQVPKGFEVTLLASGHSNPRLLRTAPNGDIFIAETGLGKIRVLRLTDAGDGIAKSAIFASGLKGPFGIAFYPQNGDPQWVYIGENNEVVRFPYKSGDLVATGAPQVIVPRLCDSSGGHSTRDVAFSRNDKRLFISVGSGSNIAESVDKKDAAGVRAWENSHAVGSSWGSETHRADILVTDPLGREGLSSFATGIRNAVGLAVQPSTGALWCSTNERDGLGDDLVPDYVTKVEEGGFYGWPWYYMGDHEDPRHAGERPDLLGHVIAPDVPEQPHSASLQMTFYPENPTGANAFPAEYRGDIFVAFHGSWNRTGRTGSKVIRIHLQDGQPVGGYEDFMTGFVIDDGHVWGRPVGVTVAPDGSLLVTDDANSTLWRITYTGK